MRGNGGRRKSGVRNPEMDGQVISAISPPPVPRDNLIPAALAGTHQSGLVYALILYHAKSIFTQKHWELTIDAISNRLHSSSLPLASDMKALARVLLPEIQVFFESEEGKR